VFAQGNSAGIAPSAAGKQILQLMKRHQAFYITMMLTKRYCVSEFIFKSLKVSSSHGNA